MPREVDHTADGPYPLTPGDIDPEYGDIAVCRCGLSPEFPFCDGSHRVTHDEAPGTVYRYSDGPDGERRVVECVRTVPEEDAAAAPTPTEEDGDGDSAANSRRLVTREAGSPWVVDREDLADAGGEIDVCRCGLSADWPRCDDSHAACSDEVPGVRYRYGANADGRRVVTGIEFADGTADGE